MWSRDGNSPRLTFNPAPRRAGQRAGTFAMVRTDGAICEASTARTIRRSGMILNRGRRPRPVFASGTRHPPISPLLKSPAQDAASDYEARIDSALLRVDRAGKQVPGVPTNIRRAICRRLQTGGGRGSPPCPSTFDGTGRRPDPVLSDLAATLGNTACRVPPSPGSPSRSGPSGRTKDPESYSAARLIEAPEALALGCSTSPCQRPHTLAAPRPMIPQISFAVNARDQPLNVTKET